MSKKQILVTGASGNLGGRTIKLLADTTEHEIIAVSDTVEKVLKMLEREEVINKGKVRAMSSREMLESSLEQYNITHVIHAAFSRAICTNRDIASSLDYSLQAFKKMVDCGIPNAIYISSQSVYGDTPQWRTEELPAEPNSVYAMAKYAGEKLFEACYWGHDELQHTILRLDIVIQSQNLVKALCKTAKEKGKIALKGGHQVFSYLDARDVPKALVTLLDSSQKWRRVYNVGPNKMRYSLVEIANILKNVAASQGYNISIELAEDDTMLWAGMNSSKFIVDTGWTPTFGIENMISEIFNSI